MAILKRYNGLIQLEECPQCNYLIMFDDMIHRDDGSPRMCKFCYQNVLSSREDEIMKEIEKLQNEFPQS